MESITNKSILKYLNKFEKKHPGTILRMCKLAKSRRKRLEDKFKQAVYTDGNHYKQRLVTKKDPIGCGINVTKNGEKGQHFKFWLNYRKANGEVLHIPMSYNKKFHDSKNIRFDATSFLVIDRQKKGNGKIHVALTTEKEYNLPLDKMTKENTIGLDINTSDNIFASKIGFWDLDREFLDENIREIAKEELKEQKR